MAFDIDAALRYVVERDMLDAEGRRASGIEQVMAGAGAEDGQSAGA